MQFVKTVHIAVFRQKSLQNSHTAVRFSIQLYAQLSFMFLKNRRGILEKPTKKHTKLCAFFIFIFKNTRKVSFDLSEIHHLLTIFERENKVGVLRRHVLGHCVKRLANVKHVLTLFRDVER